MCRATLVSAMGDDGLALPDMVVSSGFWVRVVPCCAPQLACCHIRKEPNPAPQEQVGMSIRIECERDSADFCTAATRSIVELLARGSTKTKAKCNLQETIELAEKPHDVDVDALRSPSKRTEFFDIDFAELPLGYIMFCLL
jgi:hypothetical protein